MRTLGANGTRRERGRAIKNSMLESVLSLLAALGGYVTRLVTESLHDRRAEKREREAREASRRQLLFERRAAFQRETLLNLQDALMELSRAAGGTHHLDAMEFRKSGKWGKRLLPADLDEVFRHATVKTLTLMVRVHDDRVREMVRKFREQASNVGLCRNEKESEKCLTEVARLLDPLNERIGEALRKLDEDDEAVTGEKSP